MADKLLVNTLSRHKECVSAPTTHHHLTVRDESSDRGNEHFDKVLESRILIDPIPPCRDRTPAVIASDRE